MKKLFGTDGIRGKAYNYPLDKETIFKLGKIIGKIYKNVLIGMDTRESSPFISSFISTGLKSSGARLDFAGIISTPALSWITRHYEDFDVSIMVSASHNPYEDNGIKLFSREGTKIQDEEEEKIEQLIYKENFDPVNLFLPEEKRGLINPYKEWILSLFPKKFLKGFKVLIDTANGSLSGFAQEIFLEYGANVISLGANPNGKNINDGVGTQYPENAIKFFKENNADFGVLFDGDGDRVLFILPPDNLLDGDDIIYLLALDFKERGILRDGVVGTIMSNAGLETGLKEIGIKFYRTNVGDRYVFNELKKRDLILGGEQSGHIILRNFSNTGDGLLVSLFVSDLILKKNFKVERFKKFPQRIINFPVKEKKPLEKIPGYDGFLEQLKKVLGNGRAIIRYSGTEPVLRVMIEAENEEILNKGIELLDDFFMEKKI